MQVIYTGELYFLKKEMVKDNCVAIKVENSPMLKSITTPLLKKSLQ
ncbi:hypothetical protein Gotri_018179 [Gossypium trilobum]|uniref:Uncharacterized protein n=1 Tax=Gossypium trilobum TaxID=34281 RepID=A0A7J9E8U9_9ROSI|nr:hypothetical protein [Gossypium trilobum]